MESKITIGVTGADGMLGVHLRAYLKSFADVVVKTASRSTFSEGKLGVFVKDCDVIIHLAGMNRGDENTVAQTNIELTQKLVDALEEVGSKAHLIFSSSIHIERETLYGHSKRKCAELLSKWAQQRDGKFTALILPGVFGEGAKPYYNSVVATFCYQLASSENPTPHADSPIEQIHAQDVCRIIWKTIQNNQYGEIRIKGSDMTVLGLLDTLNGMRETYSNGIIPDLSLGINRDLFNMYRSYLYPIHYPVKLPLHTDNRGSLFEAVKCPSGGQSFMSTTYPGITRGNHFHTRKVERFLVSGGEAEIKLRHIFGSDIHTFNVSGDKPSYIDIPTLHTHSIKNVGKSELLTLFWTNEIFDPANPDQVNEIVEIL